MRADFSNKELKLNPSEAGYADWLKKFKKNEQ